MKQRIGKLIHTMHREQGGQALILVLILLVIGSVMLVPALDLASTNLKTNRPYEVRTSEVYTSDAGIEEGLWRIKYDFFGPNYNRYDFTTSYEYETQDVNGITANLTIQNVWIPSVNLTSLGLGSSDLESIIDNEGLVVTGTAGAIPGNPYTIKIDYIPDLAGEDLCIKSIGVWLPQGFEFDGNSTLENLEPSHACYTVPSSRDCDGGSYTVWEYSSFYPLFTDFPGVDSQTTPMSLEIQFDYSLTGSDPNALPTGIGWVTTQLEDGSAGSCPISWDIDTRVFSLSSVSGDTQIQAYASKSESRQLDDAINGDCIATGNTLMDTPSSHVYTNLRPYSSATISTVPEDGDALHAFLYWSGFRYDNNVFSDSCSSSNFGSYWSNGGDWSYQHSNPYYYKGHHVGSDNATRLLTLGSDVNLGSLPAGAQVELTWSQRVSSLSIVFNDACDDYDNWDEGLAWDSDYSGYFWIRDWFFQGRYSSTAEEMLLTLDGPLDLSSYSGSLVTVSWEQWIEGTPSGSDGLDFTFSSDNGASWSENIEAFRGNIGTSRVAYSYTIPTEYLTDQFLFRFELVGFQDPLYCNIDNFRITPAYSDSDGLYLALSNDGGSNWSENIQAFRGNIGTSWNTFSYELPKAYFTSGFRFRFALEGMAEDEKYCHMDNIKVIVREPDTSVTLKINGQQVYWDELGEPHIEGDGTALQPVAASSASILVNEGWGGFSYSAYRDVSELVLKYPEEPGEEHHTGNATYTVGDVTANTGAQVSYAGWSLVLVYGSPETAGHYLYLYDVFSFNPQNTNLDFDYDGTPGGTITDFVIPEPIRNRSGELLETVAARLTAFVGEGDDWLYDYDLDETDCIKIIGQSEEYMYLSNANSPAYNVWNSSSYPGTGNPNDIGIDIDTFEIDWDDGIFLPGDTSVDLELWSGQDAWNLIYFILSVRSETQVSGTTHYFISRN